MKNLIKNILALAVLGAIIFVFQNQIGRSYLNLRDRFFPCDFPIGYSVGTIDPRFNVSETVFEADIKSATDIWNKASSKILFIEKPNGNLKINLVYDTRQATTQKLNNLNSQITSGKNSYESLKTEYDMLKADILATRDNVQTENDVVIINQKIAKLNNLAQKINQSVSDVNAKVRQYNSAGEILGGQFEEGLYESDSSGQKIDIYEFKNKNNLIRVLAHELGHALSLDHSNDPSSIMYYINSGTNLTLSADDIRMLREHCGVK